MYELIQRATDSPFQWAYGGKPLDTKPIVDYARVFQGWGGSGENLYTVDFGTNFTKLVWMYYSDIYKLPIGKNLISKMKAQSGISRLKTWSGKNIGRNDDCFSTPTMRSPLNIAIMQSSVDMLVAVGEKLLNRPILYYKWGFVVDGRNSKSAIEDSIFTTLPYPLEFTMKKIGNGGL